MRIIVVHNKYQHAGGEDQVFAAEAIMLENRGHRIHRYTVQNDQITHYNKLALATVTIWNNSIYKDLRRIIKHVRPDIIHIHNTLPLISPAAYYAAKSEGVLVVQTLHNYRFLCPNALFFRDGHVCEDCMDNFIPWPGVLHACYRRSRAATIVTTAMLSVHRVLRTYSRIVDVYIVLTDFARQKFIQGGLPPEKILVKPNFVNPDPGNGTGRGGYALFVGRLTQEKGINTLLSGWQKIGAKVPLKIVGDGPLASQVTEAARHISGIEWLGLQPRHYVLNLMKDATLLIFPSLLYEGFPVTIVEAYSVGLPVITSNLGSMSSLIDHNRTGLHFRPGDPEDLAKQVDWILSHPAERERMRQEARAEYEARYTAERNYDMLMEIYERAISQAHSRENDGAI